MTMTKIVFTSQAEEVLSGEEKREARIKMNQDGSDQGWYTTSSKKSVAWRVDGNTAKVGLVAEVASW